MGTVIIVLILLVIVVFAVKSVIQQLFTVIKSLNNTPKKLSPICPPC